jgi:hypothetical protein
MNPAEINILHAVHVIAVIVLIAFTFFAFAASQETRKRVLMITGVASLLVVLTGFRMWQGMYGLAALGWIFVKLACWLGLSALTGLAYRKRDQVNMLMSVALVLTVVALVMVYVVRMG